MKRSQYILLLSWVFLSAVGLKAWAQTFTAKGELAYRVFVRGQAKYSIQKSFVLQRSCEQWLIHTCDMTGIDDTNHFNLYEETASDGTNLMELEVQDTFTKSWQALASGAVPEMENPKLITVIGKTAAGVVPVNMPIGVNAVWLAFAATPYLDGITNGRVRTLNLEPEEFPQFQTVRANWQKDCAFPNLLSSVKYYNDGRTVAWLPNGKKEIVPEPAPYDHGYVDAIYSATDFTNCDGLHLPTQFNYQTFWPTYTGSNGLVVASCVEGKVTHIQAGVADASLNPRFIRKALIADERFAKDGVKNFNYTIEQGGEWWPVNYPKILAYLEFWKKNYAKHLSSPKPTETKSVK